MVGAVGGLVTEARPLRLVSVSSRVAAGHVGNAALGLPLGCLGVELVAVDSVLFSNHPGYGSHAGLVVPGETVAAILAQLDRLGVLAGAAGLLSGYLGTAETATAVAATLRAQRAARPDWPYLLDPVLGDHGRLYVAPALAAAVTRELLPLASLLTPNRFELETLAGRAIAGEAALLAAARGLLRGPTRAVLVTSAYEEGDRIGLLLVTGAGAWRLWTPRHAFTLAPNGAGDLLGGLWLRESLRQPDLLSAARLAVARLLAAIARTAAEDRRELALVESLGRLAAATPDTVAVEAAG